MTDREEREEHIKRLEAALACEEKQFLGKCSKQTCDDNCALLYEQGNWGEWKETLRYAINSLKTDLKYDLLYEETSGQADKPTTKNDLGVDYLGVDCISRQSIANYIGFIQNHGMGKEKSFDYIKKFVAKLPSATPIRPKGHWIWCFGSHKCSNCEEYTCFSDKELLRYCPNCGSYNGGASNGNE